MSAPIDISGRWSVIYDKWTEFESIQKGVEKEYGVVIRQTDNDIAMEMDCRPSPVQIQGILKGNVFSMLNTYGYMERTPDPGWTAVSN